jgi:hypothetical protein
MRVYSVSSAYDLVIEYLYFFLCVLCASAVKKDFCEAPLKMASFERGGD